jgi:hypothetical protein
MLNTALFPTFAPNFNSFQTNIPSTKKINEINSICIEISGPDPALFPIGKSIRPPEQLFDGRPTTGSKPLSHLHYHVLINGKPLN